MRRLILIVSCLSTCVLAAPHDQPVVKRDSEVVRQIYRQPLTADSLPLLTARETLKLADDQKAVDAIDAHLGSMGLAILTGTPVPEGGTIGQLMDPAQARPRASPEAVARILGSSLRAKFDHVDAQSKRLYASIGNAGNRAFRLYESTLRLRPGPDAIDMDCNPVQPTWRPLEPAGEARQYECVVAGNSYGLEGFFGNFAQANPPGTELPVKARRIEFEDPPLTLSGNRASWEDRNQIVRGQAIVRLREVSCTERGACADAAWGFLTDRPHYLATLVGAAGGLAAAAVIGFTVRRKRRAAVIASLFGAGSAVAFGVFAGYWLGGAMAVLVMGFLALVALVAFLAILWMSLAISGALGRASV